MTEFRIFYGFVNNECRISKECILSFFNKTHEIDIEFHEVSYERRLWPKKTASLIKKET